MIGQTGSTDGGRQGEEHAAELRRPAERLAPGSSASQDPRETSAQPPDSLDVVVADDASHA